MDLKCVFDANTAIDPAKKFKQANPNISRYYGKKLFLFFSKLIGAFGFTLYCSKYIKWYCPYIILGISVVTISWKLINIYATFKLTCRYYHRTIKQFPQYKNKQLIETCWNKMESMDKQWNKEHLFDQVTIGFCAYACINSILSCIFDREVFLEYPSKPTPMSLDMMYRTINDVVLNDSFVNDEFGDMVENVLMQKIEMNDTSNISLKQFENMIKQIGQNKDKYIYYVVNFNRAPLFQCNLSHIYRFGWWLRGGHFSPIIGYTYDDNDDMFVLISDANAEYGEYLVRIDRLYQATKCKARDLSSRGMIRFEVKRTV
eukprot:238979_1